MMISTQVLDARDPQGTRCRHLEKHLRENCKHKHLILLLNKVRALPDRTDTVSYVRFSKYKV